MKKTLLIEVEHDRLSPELKLEFYEFTRITKGKFYRKIKRPDNFTFSELMRASIFFNQKNKKIKSNITPEMLIK